MCIRDRYSIVTALVTWQPEARRHIGHVTVADNLHRACVVRQTEKRTVDGRRRRIETADRWCVLHWSKIIASISRHSWRHGFLATPTCILSRSRRPEKQTGKRLIIVSTSKVKVTMQNKLNNSLMTDIEWSLLLIKHGKLLFVRQN